MMRNKFDHQMQVLNNDLIEMGALIEAAIASSIKALKEQDTELAKKVVAEDQTVNQKERDIEAMCLRLLLQQQPVARDLRLISAALKMITDMERIGDQAADIAEISVFLADRPHISELIDIPRITDRIVPFHKLSQWLSYSLIEPFVDAGLTVADPDALTGLAEYRNGGLLIDTGVLRLKDPAERDATHAPTDELIVEWRALTVALLDRLAATVRAKMGVEPNALPLAAVLQGGTWSAGRRLAADLRPGGSPPLKIATDGTLF